MKKSGPVSDSFGVDVCLESLDKDTPHCPHGPTILFERYTQGQKAGQRFYACSACRDRKDCNFFQLADEKVSEPRRLAREDYNQAHQPPYSHLQYTERYDSVLKLTAEERRFCEDCSLLLKRGEWDLHQTHTVVHTLTTEQLHQPSHLLTPLDNKKTNAQYLFSDKAVNFTIKSLKELGFKKVLCVGAPRIHEAIINERRRLKEDKSSSEEDEQANPLLNSLLLDIDHRYMQFYGPNEFCRYNMFNNYFLDGKNSQATFQRFLEGGDKVVMVTDPPFGGLVEVLARTVKKISQLWENAQGSAGSEVGLPVLWFFPYFMEQRIASSLPGFTMLDYKVDYDNHVLFQNGDKGRKHGSPVRIFTNIDPATVKLPIDDGYRFCDECNRYVSSENVHCFKCHSCTSKDGRVYRHCHKCKRCVKPSKLHCATCNVCALPGHKCGEITSQGCHVCGEATHKRRECPNKAEIYAERKRKRKAGEMQNKEEKGKQKRRKKSQNHSLKNHRLKGHSKKKKNK